MDVIINYYKAIKARYFNSVKNSQWKIGVDIYMFYNAFASKDKFSGTFLHL